MANLKALFSSIISSPVSITTEPCIDDQLLSCSSPTELQSTTAHHESLPSDENIHHADPNLPIENDNCSTYGDDGFRRPAPFVQCAAPTPITDADEMVEPTEHDDYYEIRALGRCKKGHCFEKERSTVGKQ